MKTAQFYQRKLSRFFDMNYDDCGFIEWDVDPAINQWKFHVMTTDETVLLTCSDSGNVTQQITHSV